MSIRIVVLPTGAWSEVDEDQAANVYELTPEQLEALLESGLQTEAYTWIKEVS